MKTTLAGQIQIVAHARTIISKFDALPSELKKSMDEGLNDAASTIAALNLNPDIFQRVKELEAVNAELLEALKGLIEPIKGAFYCEYCDRHAPKDEDGKLTGESLTHSEDCPVISAKALIAKAEGKV